MGILFPEKRLVPFTQPRKPEEGTGMEKRRKKFAGHHAYPGITACLCGNVPGMRYQKCPLLRARLEWKKEERESVCD